MEIFLLIMSKNPKDKAKYEILPRVFRPNCKNNICLYFNTFFNDKKVVLEKNLINKLRYVIIIRKRKYMYILHFLPLEIKKLFYYRFQI